MTKEQIRIEAEAYNKSLKRHPSSEQALTEVLVEFAERLQNLQQCNVSGALPSEKRHCFECNTPLGKEELFCGDCRRQ